MEEKKEAEAAAVVRRKRPAPEYLLKVLPSRRGRRQARHRGESFVDMVLRLSGNASFMGRQ